MWGERERERGGRRKGRERGYRGGGRGERQRECYAWFYRTRFSKEK